ncbi:MAG TPA: hypothetical protein VGG25_30450 [Streptosporangiaceae bacterium]|jgi:hypothetical protein
MRLSPVRSAPDRFAHSRCPGEKLLTWLAVSVLPARSGPEPGWQDAAPWLVACAPAPAASAPTESVTAASAVAAASASGRRQRAARVVTDM